MGHLVTSEPDVAGPGLLAHHLLTSAGEPHLSPTPQATRRSRARSLPFVAVAASIPVPTAYPSFVVMPQVECPTSLPLPSPTSTCSLDCTCACRHPSFSIPQSHTHLFLYSSLGWRTTAEKGPQQGW